MKLAALFGIGLLAVAAWGWMRPPARPDALGEQRRALGRFWPAAAAALAAGASSGLARRSRASSCGGYASPTLAWIGKRAALGGLFVAAAWGVAPLGLAAGWLWLAPGLLLAGAFLYMGNLPERL